MKAVYITGKEHGSGVTSVCAGLGRLLIKKGIKPGYLKPLPIDAIDSDPAFMKEALSLKETIGEIAPAIDAAGDPAGLQLAFDNMSSGKDIVIIEGNPDQYRSSAAIAAGLNAGVIIVDGWTSNISLSIIDLKTYDAAIIGTVFNKIPNARYESFLEQTRELGKVSINCFGSIPEDRQMYGLTVRELASCVSGAMILGPENTSAIIENVMLGAMSVDSGPEYFSRMNDKAVITRLERPDMMLAALTTDTRCLVVSGHKNPPPIVMLRAEEKGIPVILTAESTALAMSEVETALDGLKMNHPTRLSRFEDLMAEHLDLESFVQALGI